MEDGKFGSPRTSLLALGGWQGRPLERGPSVLSIDGRSHFENHLLQDRAHCVLEICGVGHLAGDTEMERCVEAAIWGWGKGRR